MPNPRKGESEREFLKRCIPQTIHEGYDQRGSKQAAAICYSKYRKHILSKAEKTNLYLLHY